jgi:hypothetical protein
MGLFWTGYGWSGAIHDEQQLFTGRPAFSNTLDLILRLELKLLQPDSTNIGVISATSLTSV